MRFVLPAAFVFICAITGSLSARDLKPEVERAILKGAKAKIILKVHDDKGDPVPEANVRAIFAMMPDEYEKYGRTDSNGVYIAEGKTTGGYIKFLVGKEGYYLSEERVSYSKINEEHDVEKGKWQPYGGETPLLLRPIRNPQSMCSRPSGVFRYTDAICKWVGYDLEIGDFVIPHGKGRVADFEVFLDWDGIYSLNYGQLGCKIRFQDTFAGFYEVPVESASKFKTPYSARTDLQFNRDAEMYDRKKGLTVNTCFDKTKCWIIRSRCVADANGKLISCNYSVIREIIVCGSQDGKVAFSVFSAFNPVPNDTNLEDMEISRRTGWLIRYTYQDK